MLLLAAATASAAAPNLLTRFPSPAAVGTGANQLAGTQAIATDPTTGRVYVTELENNRISVFDAWGVFDEAWGWGVASGAPSSQTCGPAEPELSPPPSLCQKGIAGSGPGQFNFPNGIAVDPSGNVYVFEKNNARVQKFNSAGQFVLTFGGEVNKTTNGNVCTAASGNTCGIGIKGAANGFFDPPSLGYARNPLAIAPDGTVYVGDKDRIQEFEPNGSFKGQVEFSSLNSANAEFPASGVVSGLGLDPVSNDLYFFLFQNTIEEDPPIFRVDASTGSPVDVLPVDIPSSELTPGTGQLEGLALDPAGNLYVNLNPAGGGGLPDEPRVLKYSPDGEVLIPFTEEFASPPTSTVGLEGLGVNGVGDIYVGERNSSPNAVSVAVYGPPPIAYGPPPAVPPQILEQFATAAGTKEATVKATINPRFWADTKYYVEYGEESCSTSSCSTQPTPPGSTLTNEVINLPVTSAGVVITGLTPATTYHYRFVAESSGGGPVKGLDEKTGAAGEGTFTTLPVEPKAPICANQAFRPGAAALLPDCRAFEMVSPVDKNGADISVVFNSIGEPAGLDQARPDGDALTYSAYRAFGDIESSPYTAQYLADRSGTGWISNGISPPRSGPSVYEGGQIDGQYKGFSDNLCFGWLLQETDNSLASGSVEKWPDLYRRDNCNGGYQTLAPFRVPTVGEVKDFRPEVQGFSQNGRKSFFVAPGKLADNAVTATQLYEVSDGGEPTLVCILPTNLALTTGCSAGTGNISRLDRAAAVDNAVSGDGERVYWTAAAQGVGKLYVRVEGVETVAVSAGTSAQFWTAAEDGMKAVYSETETLKIYNEETRTSSVVTGGFKGLMGASSDATKLYLVSTEVKDAGATAGKPNLYYYEYGSPGTFRFIATLSGTDIAGELNPISIVPVRHVSQVSDDGSAVAFMSRASPGLTGYDNIDAQSGEADAEVYLYSATSETLACVSCLRTGARPTGRNVENERNLLAPYWAAAQLPAAENQLQFPRLLSADGDRLFFESFVPLVLRDTNAHQDVYQWEQAGTGNCSSTAPGYNAALGGCVNLISTAESPQDSSIVDSSADGSDVFIKTNQSLLPQDPGLVDIYDARVEGGFPLVEPPAEECEGEACQHPAPPPSDPTPSSQSFVGPGNPPPSKPLKCPKGKHKAKNKAGKTVCVKNKKKNKGKKKSGKSGKKGRAGR